MQYNTYTPLNFAEIGETYYFVPLIKNYVSDKVWNRRMAWNYSG